MSPRQIRTALEQIIIDLRGIGQAMKGSWLKVPPYQRDYSWEKEQVEELLGDIAEAIRLSEPEYFLGSIVLSAGSGESLHITDGQQRLATTSIIIAEIRNYFLENGEQERATELENEFLLSRTRRTREVIPRLQLNVHDQDYYETIVLRRPDSQQIPDADPSSHKRLKNAVETVRTYIGNLATVNSKDPINALLDWVEYLENQCKVIWVTVPDDSNAFTIFETLNDRGLDLAISDLLKNFLFHKAGNRLGEAQNHWTTMTGILEATSEDEVLVTYLRHYWSSVQGLTRERDLYKKVKKKISNATAAVELSKDLSNSAIKYAALSNTSHEIWREYGATTQGHIATLNLLRMVQMRPLLLSILDTLSIPEGKKSIKYLVDCAVRILIVGGRGGTVEATYCDAAKAIRENIRDASSVRAALNTIFPADTEFRNAFSIATVSKAYLARYYLRAIEQSSNGNSHPEFVPNPNAEDINLEHVIPLHPGQNWTHLSEDECKALYRRLGNMALLQSNINATTGNAAFPDKKGVLTQSSYELTKDIAKCRNWAALEVAERQNKLAELAVKTWSGKFS
jgi:hypothetical protein